MAIKLGEAPQNFSGALNFDQQSAIFDSGATFGVNTGTGNVMGSSTRATSFGKGLSEWFGDKGNQDMLSAGAGIANIGLSYMSFLENQKLAKKQLSLMDQQLANNNSVMANRSAKQAAINSHYRS